MFQLLLPVNQKELSLRRVGGLLLVCLLLGGCFAPLEAVTPVNVQIPLLTPTILSAETTLAPAQDTQPQSAYTPVAFPADVRDELPVMSGICFEAADDAAGRIFILRSAEEHIHFYNLADNSGLCRQAVTRYPFDFTTGRVLAGGWSRGTGCTAQHAVVDYQRDDAAKTIVLTLRFSPEGDCPYELVRSFWVSFADASDYEIRIIVN